jgi:hypothetical protein
MCSYKIQDKEKDNFLFLLPAAPNLHLSQFKQKCNHATTK